MHCIVLSKLKRFMLTIGQEIQNLVIMNNQNKQKDISTQTYDILQYVYIYTFRYFHFQTNFSFS